MDKKFLKRVTVLYIAFLAIWTGVGVTVAYHESAGAPVALLWIAGAIAFALLIVLLLMARYVYHDAKSRGMSPVLWTLVAVFVPYLLGLIVYLIARTPLLRRCSSCGALSPNESAFCPKCGKPLRSRCPKCQFPLEEDHRFCPACGSTVPSTSAA